LSFELAIYLSIYFCCIYRRGGERKGKESINHPILPKSTNLSKNKTLSAQQQQQQYNTATMSSMEAKPSYFWSGVLTLNGNEEHAFYDVKVWWERNFLECHLVCKDAAERLMHSFSSLVLVRF